MKIAIVGTRGIPARYGGFETFAEQLSIRLINRGHEVLVYGRGRFFSRISQESYAGVERHNAWTIFSKHLETPLAALSSFLDLFLFQKVDVILLCNAANSIFSFIPRAKGTPVVINVDGIERLRSKWGVLGRAWYRVGELCSVLFANKVIADAFLIADYYAEYYATDTRIIAYGATVPKTSKNAEELLNSFGVKKREYLLYVSRLEPENNALGVIRAYNKAKLSMPLVIVGDAPYAEGYIKQLKQEASANVIFTGYQFGDAYHLFQANCYLYIQATEVGGTHPALIESMAHGNCVVANGVPEHFEVLGGAGFYYLKNDFNHLAEILKRLVQDPILVQQYRQQAIFRANERYCWDKVTDQYLELFQEVVS